MSCKNHPNASVVANCFDCGSPMCRLCATNYDDETFCARCIIERKKKRPAKERVRQRAPHTARRRTITNGATKQNSTVDSRSLYQHWRWLIIALLLAAVYLKLLMYSNPNFFNVGAEARAEQLAVDELEACRLVFEEIGLLLEENQMPDAALRCDESYMPNIITRDGASIRISHPNPRYHGFSEIYVSNSSHEPTFVD